MTENHRQSAGPRIDETDRQLLALLRRNARMPLVALARAVRLSRSAVQGRLARLERSGAIGGYTIRGRQSAPACRASSGARSYGCSRTSGRACRTAAGGGAAAGW